MGVQREGPELGGWGDGEVPRLCAVTPLEVLGASVWGSQTRARRSLGGQRAELLSVEGSVGIRG